MSCLGLSRHFLLAGSINRAGRKGVAVGALQSRTSARTRGGEEAAAALKGLVSTRAGVERI